MTEELEKAQGLLASGDIPGLLGHMRAHGDALPLGEVARLMAGAARLAGFDDLAQAAATLGLPATDFDPGKPAAHSLVVAYDLTKTDPSAVAALRERAPGQILFERATCWTDPPRVTADVSGLLGQTVIPPWAAQIRRLEDGTVGQGPADDRPVEAIAAEIVHAVPEQDEGDGNTPPDPDEALRRFVGAVTAAGTRERNGGWLGGVREYIPGAGPVPSSRFL